MSRRDERPRGSGGVDRREEVYRHQKMHSYNRREREPYEQRDVPISTRQDEREHYRPHHSSQDTLRDSTSTHAYRLSNTRTSSFVPPSSSPPPSHLTRLSSSTHASITSSSIVRAVSSTYPTSSSSSVSGSSSSSFSSSSVTPRRFSSEHKEPRSKVQFPHQVLFARYGDPAAFRKWVLDLLADKPGIAHCVINHVYLDSRYSAPVEAEIQNVLKKHTDHTHRL